jgi:hypothetical protein
LIALIINAHRKDGKSTLSVSHISLSMPALASGHRR